MCYIFSFYFFLRFVSTIGLCFVVNTVKLCRAEAGYGLFLMDLF